MAQKLGRETPTSHVIVEENGHSAGRTSMESVLTPSELQIARLRLRERWELASVLNFLHVFQPFLGRKLEFSAEEIETALITPNEALARLHILLLKGIPPVNKNLLTNPNAWIKALREKLNVWWPEVAEGEFPLLSSHGKGVSDYKEIDPTVRLVILKALCEIRLIQDDILTYINDSLKEGKQLSTFYKDRIGGDGNVTSYWYDGDSVIGHRLYREVKNIECNQNSWEKGHLTPPPTGLQWETLATNLEEFREISDKISSSEVVVEPNVGKIVENEILPALEKLQKRKERALQRKQEKATFQCDLFSSIGKKNMRTCRDRRPTSYTFDEYDRSIDEAIEVIKGETSGHKRHEEENDSGPEGIVTGVNQCIGSGSHNSDEDDDYDGKDGVDNDDDYDGKDWVDKDGIGDNPGASGKERKNHCRENGVIQNSRKQKGYLTEVVGLRRSRRVAGISCPGLILESNANMKKQLRQTPPVNSIFEPLIISDSEDTNLSEDMGN